MIKLPTLFGRTPKHARFSFAPRHYDPQKDEREERNRRIQQELENEKEHKADGFETRIKGSFQHARKRSQVSSGELQAALVRIAILLVLVITIIAYLQWGTKAFYGFLVFVPLYLWWRLKNR